MSEIEILRIKFVHTSVSKTKKKELKQQEQQQNKPQDKNSHE